MARSRIRFRKLGLRDGLITIQKRCGFCRRRHIVEFPLDDLHVRRRMTSLCERCALELEQMLDHFPELRGREEEE